MKLVVFVVLAFCVVIKCSANEQNEEIKHLFDGRNDLFKEMDKIRDLVRYSAQGIEAFKRGHYDAAVVHFGDNLKLYPTNQALLLFRSRAYIEKHEFDKAIADADKAIQLDPNFVWAYMVRAAAHYGSRNYEKAISDLDHAISLKPKEAGLFIGRAKMYAAMDNLEAAITNYDQAILLSPEDADTYLRRGSVYALKGDPDKTIANCTRAIQLRPNYVLAYETRGKACRQIKDFEKAIVDYTELIQLTGKTNYLYYFERGCDYAELGSNTMAVHDLSEAIQLNAKDADSYAARGLVFARAGNYAKGIGDCRKAVRLEPENSMGLNNLAWLLVVTPDPKLRNGKKALEYARKAVERSGSLKPYCLGTLAAAYAEVGNFNEAVSFQKKSMEAGLPESELEMARKRLALYEQGKPYHEEK